MIVYYTSHLILLGLICRPDMLSQHLVQCIPLYSLLLALNVTTVDYFSLDIEGAELQVLQTIPFDKIKFQIITVEYHSNNRKLEQDKIESIKNIILATGEYYLVGYLKKAKKAPYYVQDYKGGMDVIFRRRNHFL